MDSPSVAKSRARERRREGRSKTFDWAEFRPIAQALAQQRAQEAESFQADLVELERSHRREERRKRYEFMTSSAVEHPAGTEAVRSELECVEAQQSRLESVAPVSVDRQQRVEEVIEQHWRQVEKTPIREERRVPLAPSQQQQDSTELEQLLETYKQGVGLSSIRIFFPSLNQQRG